MKPPPAPELPTTAKPPAGGLRTALLGLALAAIVGGVAFAFWSHEDAGKLWEQAQEDYREKRPELAEAALAKLAGLRPLSSPEWLLRGLAAQVRGRSDEALGFLGHIPEADPLGAVARLREGQVERARNRMRVAEGRLRHALELDPKLILAHRELIFIYGMQQRKPEMYEHFRSLGALTELSFDDLFLWCLSRGLAWEPGEAASAVRKYVEADPTDRDSRLALVDLTRRLNRADEVERLLSALPDDDPDARAARAQVALDAGDIPRAETLLAGGPEAHPALARLRGGLSLARRDWPSAIRHYRAALAADPFMRDALRGLGQALTAAGDREGAAPPLEKARALDHIGALIARAAITGNREKPSLMRELGDACRVAGLAPEARGWYRLVIARDPLDADAQRGLYLLERAEKAQIDAGTKKAIRP